MPPWWQEADCPAGVALGSQSAGLGFRGPGHPCCVLLGTWCFSGAMIPNVHQQVGSPMGVPSVHLTGELSCQHLEPSLCHQLWRPGAKKGGWEEGLVGAAIRPFSFPPGVETPHAALCLETTVPLSVVASRFLHNSYTGLILWIFPSEMTLEDVSKAQPSTRRANLPDRSCQAWVQRGFSAGCLGPRCT